MSEIPSQNTPHSRSGASCHTSDILRVRQPNTTVTKSIVDDLIGLVAVGDDDKENKQPNSSSPTGKLLKLARDALIQPPAKPVKTEPGHDSINARLNVGNSHIPSGLPSKH